MPLLLGLALWCSPSVASQRSICPSDQASLDQVGHSLADDSIGKNGTKLDWRPYRPTAEECALAAAPRRVRQVEYRRAMSSRPTRADQAMKDPFGDEDQCRSKPTPAASEADDNSASAEETVRLADSDTRNPQFQLPSLDSHQWKAPDKKTKPTPATNNNTTPNATLHRGQLHHQLQPVPESNQMPPLEHEFATDGRRDLDECPPPTDFKPINEISYKIAAKGGTFPQECSLKEETYQPRSWCPLTYAWLAAGTCHKPLYFEDVHLERYGHSWGPYLQPVISHGHFFLSVPVLPYMMGLCPPNECQYTLGYYRPGSCAPYMLDPLPISIRAGLWEAGVWTGAAFLVP